MDFVAITVEFLKFLADITGSYGLGIVLFTLVIRAAMWPLSFSQQKSMKKMQELAPKLKQLQARYKNDPQAMQMKMMEFYKDHKFNPLGGCLPAAMQLPVFLLLYAALMSPQFMELSGNSSFMFIGKLSSTLRDRAGVIGDAKFAVERQDKFILDKHAKVYLKNGQTIEKVVIVEEKKAIVQPELIIPGQTIKLDLSLNNLDLPYEQMSKVEKTDVTLINENTKEIEHITFKVGDSKLSANVQTEKIETKFNYDVLTLIVLFVLTMIVTQKIMSKMSNSAAMDPTQKQMQEMMTKLLPIAIVVPLLFIPIPAGVFLYFVVSNIFQIAQTIIINKQLETESKLSSYSGAIQVETVEKKTVKTNNQEKISHK